MYIFEFLFILKCVAFNLFMCVCVSVCCSYTRVVENAIRSISLLIEQ